MLKVWSEKPIVRSFYFWIISFITFNPTFSAEHGYLEEHWNNTIRFSLKILIAFSISFQLDIPVDNKIGLPLEQINSNKGMFVVSPETILFASISVFSNTSTVAWENGETIKYNSKSWI